MILALAACLLAAVLLWLSTRKPRGFPPGPPRWPIVGGTLHMQGDGKVASFFHGTRNAIEKYGDVFGFHLGRLPIVVVADFHLVKDLFSRAETTSRPPGRPNNELRIGHEDPELGGRHPGILFSDGRHWKDQRRFVLRNLRDFGFGKASMEGMLLVEVERLRDFFKERVGEKFVLNGSINISILNALWTIMAGDSFQLDDPKLLNIVDILEHGLKNSSVYSPLAFILPHPSMSKLPIFRNFSNFPTRLKMITTMHELINAYIKEHQQTFQRDHPRDLMDLIIQESQDTTDPGSPFFGSKGEAAMSNIFIEMFAAGMGTTSATLVWTFLYLIHHPDVGKKVHEELDKICGRDRLPSSSDQEKMPYVSAVLHESLRITALAFNGLPHYTTRDIEVRGFRIPKDSVICGCIHHIMNDPTYWKDPSTFKPERFIDEETGKFVPDQRVIAFGLGKRSCLGQTLAEKELFLFFAGIMQNFEIQAAPDEELPGYGVYASDPKGVQRLPPEYQVVLKSRI